MVVQHQEVLYRAYRCNIRVPFHPWLCCKKKTHIHNEVIGTLVEIYAMVTIMLLTIMALFETPVTLTSIALFRTTIILFRITIAVFTITIVLFT